MHLVIDSIGLKLFGQGGWDAEKHDRAPRSWRKLHLAVNADTGEIVASVLTDNASDDAGEVSALLAQVNGQIASVTADGAYDGQPVYQAIASHQPDPPSDVIIPPCASAVVSTADAVGHTQRNRHIQFITETGRMAWQKAIGCGQRALAETTVGR